MSKKGKNSIYNYNKKAYYKPKQYKETQEEKDLKKEIQEYSSKKTNQNKEIINQLLFKEKLIKTLKIELIILSIIFFIYIVVMCIYRGDFSVIAYNSGHFSVINLLAEILISALGLSFLIVGCSKKIDKKYRKKSIMIGLQIILIVIMLWLYFFCGVLNL